MKFRKIALILCVVSLGSVLIGLSVADKTSYVAGIYFNDRKVPIYEVDTIDNKIAISFDAAWGADKTSEIMSICESYNVKATFFLVGFWIDKYPEKVVEIYNRGFEIGLHSNTHPDMTKLSRSQMRDELKTNIDKIYNLTNKKPTLFRPPYGYYNNNLIDICEELHLHCIEWSVDSLDWKGLSASELSSRVISKADNGDIVLFHNNSDNIIEGLKMVLETFKLKNKTAVPIGELIYYENYKIDTQGIQRKEN